MISIYPVVRDRERERFNSCVIKRLVGFGSLAPFDREFSQAFSIVYILLWRLILHDH